MSVKPVVNTDMPKLSSQAIRVLIERDEQSLRAMGGRRPTDTPDAQDVAREQTRDFIIARADRLRDVLAERGEEP